MDRRNVLHFALISDEGPKTRYHEKEPQNPPEEKKDSNKRREKWLLKKKLTQRVPI